MSPKSFYQISVKVNGQPIIGPENVGIDKSMSKDHSLDKYGMQGMSPLHTHDSKGTIHVESSVKRDYTLGEFLYRKTVKVTVNGQPVSDWRNHILKDRTDQFRDELAIIDLNDR
jgi:hypothetical protein